MVFAYVGFEAVPKPTHVSDVYSFLALLPAPPAGTPVVDSAVPLQAVHLARF